MIKVYVWEYRGKNEAWGHASLHVDTTYISWWPESPGQVPSKIHPQVYSSHPFRNRTFAADVAAERMAPDHTVEIDGLNEASIKDWWAGFGLVREGVELHGPLLPWSTLSQNCSTVVAMALRAGGADKYASWWKSWNVVWKPSDVLDYAQSVRDGLKRARG